MTIKFNECLNRARIQGWLTFDRSEDDSERTWYTVNDCQSAGRTQDINEIFKFAEANDIDKVVDVNYKKWLPASKPYWQKTEKGWTKTEHSFEQRLAGGLFEGWEQVASHQLALIQQNQQKI